MVMLSSFRPGLVTSAVLVVVIVLSCFTSIAFADTYSFNNIKVRSTFLVYLDEFWFTKPHQGQIQLNVSNISFSNPNPASFNLSQIAFFLIPRNYTTLHRYDFDEPCSLNQSYIPPQILYTFDNLIQYNENLTTKTSFELLITNVDTDNDVSDLYFQSCSYENKSHSLSMNVQTSMYNLDPNTGHKSYLSSTKSLFPKLYLLFFLVHFSLACLWVCFLYKNINSVCRIHVSMLMVVIFKALSILLKLLNVFYLSLTGCAQCSTSLVLTYISDFFKETPLIIVMILIIFGWSYMKSSRSYCMMTILVLFFFCLEAFFVYRKTISIVRRVSSPFSHSWISDVYTSNQLSLSVLFLYIAISSVVKFLYDAKEAHGKASLILKRIKQYRLLFIVFMLYSVYNMAVSYFQMYYNPTQYLWSIVALQEIGTVILYVFIGYLFRPDGVKLNMPIIDDDEKVAYEYLNTNPDRYMRYMIGVSFRLPEP